MGAERAEGTQRWGAAALVAAGVLFVVYPVLRPSSDASGLPGPSATAFASPLWSVAHVAAMLGFVLLPAGLVALRVRLGGGALVTAAVVTGWAGAGLLLPCYGTEAFALHALGETVVASGDLGLMGLADAIRGGGLHLAMFASGLLLLAACSVLAACAVWRRASAGGGQALPRWSALVFAAGIVLFVPGFLAPAAVRIADGVLIALGCGVLAAAMARPTRTH